LSSFIFLISSVFFLFSSSHDTQRNGRAQLTYKNGNLYAFATIFMLAHPYGQVRVMSSYYFSNTDQGPPSTGVNNGKNCQDGKNWVCEHRWTAISNMVAWRNSAGTSDISHWQNGNSNQIAFSRGGKSFIAMNRASSSSWTVTLSTGLPAGTYCNVIVSDELSSCPTVVVNSNGQASITVGMISAVAIHTGKKK
jgi:alpha-amylase